MGVGGELWAGATGSGGFAGIMRELMERWTEPIAPAENRRSLVARSETGEDALLSRGLVGVVGPPFVCGDESDLSIVEVTFTQCALIGIVDLVSVGF